jgi:hypothetical protein
VPITSCILPILHAQIDIGNHLLKDFLDWVDLRIERVPVDEIEARYTVYEANTELQIQNELWDEWVSLKGSLLADLRQERAMINYTETLQDVKASLFTVQQNRRRWRQQARQGLLR